MGKRKRKSGTTMTRRYMTFPSGPWGDVRLPIFTSAGGHYVYVARFDIATELKNSSMTLTKFQQIFRSCDSIKDSMWSKFMVVETSLPYLLDVTHKPAHQTEGWAGPHIYTLITLSGLAAVLGGFAGATQKLPVLFPNISPEYLNQAARACIDKHNELTGQSIPFDILEKLAHQNVPTYVSAPKTPPVAHLVENTPVVEEPPAKKIAVRGRGKGGPKRRPALVEATAVANLTRQKRILQEQILDLKAMWRGYTVLIEDLQKGLIATLPFVIEEEDDTSKAYQIEIDVDGATRRVPVDDDGEAQSEDIRFFENI